MVREKQFAGHLINSNTELIFMDEWTEDSLCCEDAKKLLQGKCAITYFMVFHSLHSAYSPELALI